MVTSLTPILLSLPLRRTEAHDICRSLGGHKPLSLAWAYRLPLLEIRTKLKQAQELIFRHKKCRETRCRSHVSFSPHTSLYPEHQHSFQSDFRVTNSGTNCSRFHCQQSHLQVDAASVYTKNTARKKHLRHFKGTLRRIWMDYDLMSEKCSSCTGVVKVTIRWRRNS